MPGEPLPASDTLADTSVESAITPPVFASNISYRESKGKSGGSVFIAAGGLAILLFAAVVAIVVWRISTGNEREIGTNETGIQNGENTAVGNNNIALSNRSRPISKVDQAFSQINALLNSADILKNKVAIESDVKAAKGRFPDDYRFAYQAAKLEAITSKGHHEAFEMCTYRGQTSN